MRSYRHRLPPLRSLLTFEAAARHLNFTRAAEELHVTQAAVSKQVKGLETWLGLSLFERRGRQLSLTNHGQFLLTKVNASLEFLCDAVEAVGPSAQFDGIYISANTAMSQLWLGPMLHRFYQQEGHQTDNVYVVTTDNTQELLADHVHLAILYDVSPRPGWQLTPLFDEQLFPVASPDYLDQHGRRLDNASGLKHHQLLDFDRVEPNWVDWRRWLEGLGSSTDWLVPKAHYTRYTALMEAAELGQGVALGTHHQIDFRIAAGRLERLGRISLSTGRKYWLALNESRAPDPAVQTLHDWLAGNVSLPVMPNEGMAEPST